MRSGFRLILFEGLLVLALSGLGGCAEPAAQAGSRATSASSSQASPQVLDAVRAATSRSASPTEVVSIPNQGQLKHVTLGEGYQHVVVGRLEADGTVSTSCVDSAPQAEAFLSGGHGTNVQ